MPPKKPAQTLPTPKHSLPVTSNISSPPTAPTRERNVHVRQLTTPTTSSSRIPLPPNPFGGTKKKNKRKKKEQKDESSSYDAQPIQGRVILPASSQEGRRKQQQGGGTTMPKTMVKPPKTAEAVSSTSTLPAKPRLAVTKEHVADQFVEVAGPSGEVTFTVPRGAELNASIATHLGPRKADVLESHDREVRSKRQKAWAQLLKDEMKVDEKEEKEPEWACRKPLLPAAEMPDVDTRKEADEEWVDMDDDEDLIVTSIEPIPSQPQPALTASTAFPPPKPSVFPAQQARVDSSTEPNYLFTFTSPAPFTSTAPDPPDAAPTLSATAQNPPSSAISSNPFASLPKALPLPTGATPKVDLRSAAAILRGKQRKPKKLKQAPQLFDYLSGEDTDDWEDVEVKKGLAGGKRPKDGRAVEGRIEVPIEEAEVKENKQKDKKNAGNEGKQREEEMDVEPELAGEAKKRADRDVLPQARREEAERLVPRSYQIALIERAREGNVITVMPTGSGKTLVAVHLIEWVASTIEQERQAAGRPKRIQFFLTNSVPLVHQQAHTLATNTTLRVGKLFGALGVNLCSATEWKYNFEHFDVLVVTAQLILDSLAHGFLKMSQISLLVFDEAHHAKRNHPFASILRDFYHRAALEDRPRILGLTASPIDSKQGVEEANKLESLFDAKLVTAPPETRAELESTVSRPTVLRMQYAAAPVYSRTELYQAVLAHIIVQDEQFKKSLEGAESLLQVYGPDASDLVWHIALERYKRKYIAFLPSEEEVEEEDGVEGEKQEKKGKQEGKVVDNDGEGYISTVRRKREERREEKKRLKKESDQKRLRDMKQQLPEWMRIVEEHKPSITYDRLSPKMQKLVDCLCAARHEKERFCGIIFKRRIDALIVAEIIKKLAKVTSDLNWLRVACVTGHGAGTSNKLGPRMQWAEQADVLTAFGDGETNLLVATSVVEEGLDVQPCNFVVRFDLYTTHISYIQSHGRARAPGSHYVLFVEKDNLAQKRMLLSVARFDLQISDFLTIERELETEDEDAEDYFGAADERLEYYPPDSAGAVITPHFALSLLQRYCHSLPKSDAFSARGPQFGWVEHAADETGQKWWTCTIALPSSSKSRLVEGPKTTSPKLAKRSAAFYAVKVLHKVGALDDNLLPFCILPPENIVDASGNAVGSKKHQVEYEKAVPQVWRPSSPCGERTTTWFASLVHYGGKDGSTTIKGQPYHPIVLLTRNELPPVPQMTIYIEGEALPVFASSAGSVALTLEQRETLTDYNLQLWRAVLNKEMRVGREMQDGRKTTRRLELVYFVAELKPEVELGEKGVEVGDLAWERMASAARDKEVQLDWRANLDRLEEELEGKVIVDMAKDTCRYFFERVRRDLNADSILPRGRQSDKFGGRDCSLMEYYLAFNEPYFHKVKVETEGQPLLEVSRMSKSVTFLSKTPRNDASPSQKRLIQHLPRFSLPQVCLVHYLPAAIFRTAYLLPSILTGLDQRLLVLELNERVFENKLDHEQLCLALTTPSASVGQDYQRLELLGDALLKYLFSTYLFAVNEKTAHEGQLHRARLAIIKNENLCLKVCTRIGLPAHLVSRPFTSRHFLPPNFELLKGQPPPTSAVIGGKTIADAVEAVHGAAIETGYEQDGLNKASDLGLMVAKTIGLELDGIVVWDDFARRYGHPGAVQPVSPDFRPIEEALGHSFKHGTLVVEALTHPSKVDSVSFERSEWLGDAALDYCVLRWAWKKWGGDLSEGHLTELKGTSDIALPGTLSYVTEEAQLTWFSTTFSTSDIARFALLHAPFACPGGCVSNETLAALAIELDLDRFLLFDHEQLAINLRLYRERVVAAKSKEYREAESEQRHLRPYWLTLDPPKAVADIIESLFGAVYIDSGFDPMAVEKAFDRAVVPFIDRWVSPTSLKVDAIRKLLEMAQRNNCDDVSHVSSTLDPRTDPETGEFIPRLTRCSVVAHNLVLATCETANAKIAKKIASSEALNLLNSNPSFFHIVCDCPDRRAIAKEIADEHQQRLRDEGLLSEPDSEDDDMQKEIVYANGVVGGKGSEGEEGMEVDA
ncbi:hypothetical protein JCM11251_006019 [Rhodosporidiobolus azoricus]